MGGHVIEDPVNFTLDIFPDLRLFCDVGQVEELTWEEMGIWRGAQKPRRTGLEKDSSPEKERNMRKRELNERGRSNRRAEKRKIRTDLKSDGYRNEYRGV